MPSGGDDLFKCRVCGLIQADPPWGIDGRDPSFDICDCCGTEFGYQDTIPAAVAHARAAWLAGGAQWRNPEAMPAGWNLQDQLAGIPAEWKDLENID